MGGARNPSRTIKSSARRKAFVVVLTVSWRIFVLRFIKRRLVGNQKENQEDFAPAPSVNTNKRVISFARWRRSGKFLSKITKSRKSHEKFPLFSPYLSPKTFITKWASRHGVRRSIWHPHASSNQYYVNFFRPQTFSFDPLLCLFSDEKISKNSKC